MGECPSESRYGNVEHWNIPVILANADRSEWGGYIGYIWFICFAVWLSGGLAWLAGCFHLRETVFDGPFACCLAVWRAGLAVWLATICGKRFLMVLELAEFGLGKGPQDISESHGLQGILHGILRRMDK